jgi:UDP-galactopyranose mutase
MPTAPVVDVLVVGAGFAGAVTAERLAASGRSVLVIDRREHLGGNAHDRIDAHGHLIHPYGPHIFHTGSEAVVEYLSQFTAWRPYQHRVLARVRSRLLPIPINRTTINRLYGLELDEAGVAAFLARAREPRAMLRHAEDAVLDAVGRELYELFFRGYTRKQWGMDASLLDAAVTARIPVRHNDDDRYFTDRFQQMPADGYDRMFSRLLDHPRIRVETATAWDGDRHRARCRHVVWTGALDAYFGHRLGRLPYRSLRFEHIWQPGSRVQPTGTINEPDESVPYTRTTEFAHLTGCSAPGTALVREHPSAEGDPYYPVPTPESRALADRYRALAEAEPATSFVGRLAQYRYFNMDQVVGAALALAKRLADA